MKKPIDFKDRERSVSTFSSYLVEAGAGAGKTEQLSRRTLALLSVSDVPEQVLNITFTKKATSETRNRTVKYLKLGEQNEPPEQPHLHETWELARKAKEQDTKKGWDILKNPSRLQIMTMDSFCLKIVNDNPILNGYGKTITPVEDAEHLYEIAATEYVNSRLLEDKETNKINFVNYCGNNRDRAISCLASLLGSRDQWLDCVQRNDFAAELQSNMNQLLDIEYSSIVSLASNEHWKRIFTLLLIAKENLSVDYPAKESRLSELLPYDSTFPPKEAIKIFCDFILSKTGDIKTNFDKRSGFGAAFKEEKSELLRLIEPFSDNQQTVERYAHIPTVEMSQQDLQAMTCIGKALSDTYAILNQNFRSSGECDFIEITDIAIKIIENKDTKSALKKLNEKYKHILIDEFQDTSSQHYRLIMNITDNWNNDKSRTLFLVGDKKQSLYLFRSAALGLFIKTKELGFGTLKMKNLEFLVNFRSAKSIVDWVNDVFSVSLPDSDDSNMGAASYTLAPPFSEQTYSDSINTIISAATDDTDEDERKEAILIVDQIKCNLEQYPNEDNAILIRSRSYLRHIDVALKQANLNYTGVDLVKLFERQPIIDLINLTTLTINPDDTISLLGFLRSPMVGVLQNDLFKILEQFESTDQTLFETINDPNLKISLDCRERLNRFSLIFTEKRKMFLKTKFRYVIENLWLSLNGKHFTEDLQPLDIESYFKLIERQEKCRTINDWDKFEKSLKKLYISPHPSSNKNIQVMTIHKSKGLEFDNVFIPGMGRSSRGGSKDIISWIEYEHEGSPLFTMACKAKHGGENSPHLRYIKSLVRDKEVFEMGRLLYVGCTRAVKRLYLYATLKKKGNYFVKPANTSLISFIYEAIEQDIHSTQNMSEDSKITTPNEPRETLNKTDVPRENDKTYKLLRYVL